MKLKDARKRQYSPYKTINGKKDRINRIVMSEHLGRPLESHEHVYHVDGDCMNNAIENLCVITRGSCKAALH